MKTLALANTAAGDALVAQLDTAAGLPYTPTDADLRGRPGLGHVPHAQARTLHAVAPVTSPDGAHLAVIVDAAVEATLPAPQLAQLVPLDPAVWLPGPAVQVVGTPDAIADGPLPG